MEKEFDQVRIRKEKVQKLREMGIDPFPYIFFRTHFSEEVKENFDSLEEKEVVVAGRLVSRRLHGKAGFVHIEDDRGRIQIYFKYDTLQDRYALVKLLDLGDFIGVKGKVFRTKTGEVTVWAENVELLSKALHPPPEKYHGLKDIELRYRNRHLDLMANPEVRDRFRMRTRIIQGIREFFVKEGFLEVETPVLQPRYGGAFARPFITHYNALDRDYFLRIANEIYLKRLIIGGFEKVFEMGKMFRNEGLDRFHNPEFTNLEAYHAYADYNVMMELVENLFLYLSKDVLKKDSFTFQGMEIVIKEKWERITYFGALEKYTGIDFYPLDMEETKRKAEELGVDTEGKVTKGKILDAIFDKFVQPDLVQPVFVIDYPVDITPLAKKKRGDDNLVERFEPFMAMTEIGNAYSELNNPEEQKERFLFQQSLREKGDMEATPIDEDFIQAMMYGMPPTGGLGLGVDRVVMLLLDVPSIRDAILFPQLRE